MALNISSLVGLETTCTTYYDCEPDPYIPPIDPCINDPAYCQVATTTSTTVTTTTTVLNQVTSTNTLTNTVTIVRAFYTTSTITSTETIASYSTTTVTNTVGQVVTQTVDLEPETSFGFSMQIPGMILTLTGTVIVAIGYKKGGK